MQFLVKANIFPFLRDYSLRIEANINPLIKEMWNYHCNNCENKGKCSYILCVCLGMEVIWATYGHHPGGRSWIDFLVQKYACFQFTSGFPSHLNRNRQTKCPSQVKYWGMGCGTNEHCFSRKLFLLTIILGIYNGR